MAQKAETDGKETEPANRRKILIGIDGSENSGVAFQWYAQKIHRDNDMVLLVFVQDEIPVEPYPKSSIYYDQWLTIVKTMKEQADFMVKSYEKKCQEYGFQFEPVILETGKAGKAICRVVKDEDVQLLVLGSRGKSSIRRTIMGSVSSYCVHHAHVPVVVVPHADRSKQHEEDDGSTNKEK